VLAGNIFNPPHLRGRFGVTWENGPFTAALNGNYIGPVKDIRTAPSVRVGSMTTFDINLRYEWGPGHETLSGLSIGLLVQNALNTRPDLIDSPRLYQAPYDSTNYSPFGRVLALSLAKKW
ncbi:MAG: TonB-dependent receptor, partial [Novosphingobium sp.]